jgi:hypothetical protein
MFGNRRARLTGQHPAAPPSDHRPTVTGWAPLPGAQGAHQQIGAFAGQMLNQYPANIPGVQLHSGREGNNPGWYYPSLTVIPNGNLQQTQRPNNVNGGQRYGSLFSGPIGPLSARRMAANVAAQQVRQSGLTAMQWAQGLSAQQ